MAGMHGKNKQTNTFRFKSFGERVNEIDIRQGALYRIGHENEELDESECETLFAQTIRKWMVLNLTTEYNEFCKKCHDIVTLPQLIYKKEFVKTLLLNALDCCTVLSLEPILDVLVAFAKDVREEFYPYFDAFFEKLVGLLRTQDSDQLEWTFRCLAYLCKSLRPFLKRNITVVLSKIIPLLDTRINPEYIVDFASECFSFVARDVKDFEKFLHITIKLVSNAECGLSGCGKLLFELVRGVGGNFHSVAKDFLTALLSLFMNTKYDQNVVFEIVQSTVAHMLEKINANSIALFWDILHEIVNRMLKNISRMPPKAIFNIILVFKQSVSWKNGQAIADINQIVNLLMAGIEYVEDQQILMEISSIMIVVLHSDCVKLPQLDASRLTRKMLSVNSTEVYESFVSLMTTHSQFEVLVLPHFLGYFETNCTFKTLDLLVNIIQNRSERNSVEQWTNQSIQLKKSKTFEWLEHNIENVNLNHFDTDSLGLYLLSVMLYPSVVGGKNIFVCRILKEHVLKFDFNKNDVIALISLQSLLNMDSDLDESFLNSVVNNLLNSKYNSITTLSIFNLIFDYAHRTGKAVFSKALFSQLQASLSDNLSASNHDIRLLTGKVLSYFCDMPELQSIYKTFYEATRATPNVHTYREQLLTVQTLSASGQIFKCITIDSAKLDCLKFLLGYLYQNFKLTWEPTMKLIEELADKLPVDAFWDIYRRKLEETDKFIRSDKMKASTRVSEHIISNIPSKALSFVCEPLNAIENKTDFLNYRILLWKNISNFGVISEVKNKDVVGFLLDFVEKEYRIEDESNRLTWNVKIDHDSDKMTPPTKTYGNSKKQNFVASTLLAMLEVFAKFANPKQLYRESEIKAFYYELLSGTNEQLQKLALDCLMRYKLKSCLPYKDHLYALIDDKKFKEELVNFKLDEDTNMISTDHRPELMKIVLRILYGKMRSKTNNKFISNQTRRSIVIRFLAGCKTDEIFWFLQMTFENYQDILKIDLDKIPAEIQVNLNLERILSPKKLRSALNIVELIRKNFGGLMTEDFHVYILKVIMLSGAVCRGVFDSYDKVNEKYLAVFKNLRSQSLMCLVNFIEHFQDFSWKTEYMRSFFEVFVWPIISKLPDDCLHAPTPLLKLFIVLSQNSRHFKWLDVVGPNHETPIGVTITMLASDKPALIIRKAITDMIERILIMEENEKTDDNKACESILKAHCDKILERLMRSLTTKGSRKNFGPKELYILTRLTQMNLNGSVCDKLLQMVLPIASGKARILTKEESTSQLVLTLTNLLQSVSDPEQHIRRIIPLFEKINDISTRKQLSRLLHELSKRNQGDQNNVKVLAEMADNLNAWDRKWVEQPDYDKRLSALRDSREKMERKDMDIELGLLVIYNCFYFLNHDKDLGLRDNASLTLRLLVPGLIKLYAGNKEEINFLLNDVLFDMIRRSLRGKNDQIRNEAILLLGEMVRKCPDVHPVLSDLKGLSSIEDTEVDFFENVTHLQLHRHGRALQKFCTYAKEVEKPISSQTLTLFILPLAAHYLLTEKFAGKHTLIDATIESIGMICRFLPWHQYYAVLRYYLQKMRYCREYQKQCIRIVISILDAFHFDLGNATGQVTESAVINVEQAEKNVNAHVDDLDAELDELDDGKSNVDDKAAATPAKKARIEPYFEQFVKLSPSAARNVIETITSNLVPSLNKSITELTSYESKHKVNRRRVNFEREEEESLRVPIALAIVKLLKKLPKKTLDVNVNGVFLKVCAFLKSPVKSVRMLTRDILKKIMLSIGSEYLPLLLSQMTVLLTRGFQVHVLSVTLHSVLDCLKDDLKPEHIQKSLQYILNVTLNDIFGDPSDEKDVNKIGATTPEAKPSAKSFLAIQITAQNIPQNCLLDLLVPIKQYLHNTQSKKIVTKIQECLQKITSGLADNSNLTPEMLVEFIYGIVNELIPELAPQAAKLTQVDKDRLVESQQDCFLIHQEPRSRSGAIRKVVKTNVRANAYILIEFGLELLHVILRRKKLGSCHHLEPLIPSLKKSLESTQLRTCILSLKCLTSIWIGYVELSTLKDCMEEVVKQIFVILHKNFNFGVARKDDNFQLTKSAMKAVGCVISHCDYFQVSQEHVTQLVFYIGQDVNESDKQPVAFSLLKSLIDKELYSKELHEIMLRLCEISITSESDYSRNEARSVLLNYTAMFHKQKKTDSILKFFIAQLNYEVLAGRSSAVKFIETAVRKLTVDVLNRKADVLYLGLGTRLVNEDVPECRVLIAQCIELLILRLDNANRKKLFDMTVLFFDGSKPAVREMAACLCSRFIEVEKEKFLPRAVELIPIIDTQLNLSNSDSAGKFVKAKDLEIETNNLNTTFIERATDHSIIQVQNCILKILTYCAQVLAENSLIPAIDSIAYASQRLLAHDHDWVRLNSVKILNAILPTVDISELTTCTNNSLKRANVGQFIHSNPEDNLRSLTLDLCAQLVPGSVDEEFTAEVSKCLLFIGNILSRLESTGNSLVKINLHWLLRRVRYAIHGEVAKAPKSTVLRQSLFDWMEGIVALLDVEHLLNHCPAIISSLIREISDEDTNINAKLKQKAIKTTNKIRKKIGDVNYDKLRIAAQKTLLMKRAARKKELAQEKILDPVRSAKRKSNQKERKKEAKRRKLDVVRGKGVGMRKKKRKEMEEVF